MQTKRHLNLFRRAAAVLLLAMLTATTAWAQGYNFIDADGTVHNTATEGITVTEINASNMPTTLTSGWYVVTEDVNYTSGIKGVTTSDTYDITIILVNGKTMNIGSAGTPISDMSGLQCGQLTIYGQSLDPATAGSLNVYTNHYDGIHTATNYYQNSGNVSVTSNYNGSYVMNAAVHAERDFALNCGKLTANGTNGHGVVANNVAVLGGQLDAISNDNNFFGIFSYTNITFMWKHVSDYIHVSSYCGDNSVGITTYKHFWTDDATPVNISSNVDDASTLSGKTLTPDYSAHFSVNDAGTEYTIHTADGWGVFCDALQDNDTWNRFSGKTVKLGDNITVSRMAGGSYHDFCGTFDGQGNTLTVNISSDDITDGSTQYVAPFRYVSNTKADPSDEADSPATIRNLHVTGTITTDKQFTGGLIGGCWGTVIVENCRVSTAITSTISGDGTHGGIVGIQQNGALTITGCLFDGSLLGATTYAVGGFIGWRKSGAEIRNSLFAPAEVTVLNTSGATFSRNKVDTYNSYYTTLLNDGTNYAPYDPADADHPDKYNNGHALRTVAAGTDVTIDAIALTGTATQYDVSGIVAYSSGGLYLDGNLYYGSGDQLSLTLSNSATGAPLGYQYGYTASAGTLDGTTLTMPDEDVTISVNTAALAPIDWATVSDGDSEADPYMIYNKDQLLLLAHRVNGTNGETADEYMRKYFKLGANITFSHAAVEGDDYAENYEAIGNEDRFFCGNFDGANHTVSGIRIRKTGSDAANSNLGLFGCIAPGANIHDVHLTDARITGNCCVGGIVGFNGDGYIMRCSVTDSYITAVGEYGTICGENSNATLTNNYYHGCTVNGTENATNVGCFILGDFADITANNGALPAYVITLGDGVSTTALASAPENGFVYNGVSYYREGLALPLASTLGSEAPEGYTLSFSANGTALSGNTYTVNTTDGDVTITAAILSDGLQHEVSYVDADGTTQTAQAIALDGHETTLAAGWYFVGKDIDYTATITLGGDVNLILADGCTMNIGTNDNKINDYGIHGYINKSNQFDLTIYGQSLGTGDLNVYTTGNDYHHAILVNNLTINGGIVTAITNDSKATALYATSDLTINGGNVTATGTGYSSGTGICCYDSVTINGGIVTASGKWNGINGDGVVTINGGNVTANGGLTGIYAWVSSGIALTLGWPRPDDFITASSISTEGGTVAVADGQALTDGSGNIYTGTLTDDEISAIAGKTLRPCISYLDSDGETQYCADYTVLTGDETTLAAGWYFVGKDIDYTATITLAGDVSLILADGCTMHIGSSESRINGNGIARKSNGDQALTIYGQTAGTGTLCIYTDNGKNGIVAKAVTINGGNVTIDANGKWSTGILTGDGNIIINSGNVNVTATDDAWGLYANGNVNVNGGNVNATGGSSGIRTDNGDIAINGGNVTATGSNNGIHSLNGGITLGYTNPTDYILVSSYEPEDGTVAVADGLYLTDGTSTYSGTLTDDEISAIAGQTLRPVATMDNIPDQTYTGSEIKPEPLVMAGSLNLTKGTDYEYSYTDNVNVGTAKVTVTFKGDYASLGSVEKEFNIVRATPTVTAPTANTLTYNGNEQELVTAGSTDFGKVLYSLDGTNYSKDIPKATDAGTYTVYYKVDTDNYFYAPQTVEVTIAEESKTEPITTQISYVTANGQASEEVTAIVLDENTVIDEDFDWSQPVYYVTGDVVYSDAYFMFSNPNGVTLILADDANLNVGTIMTYHPYEDGSTEYGTYDVIITKAVGAEGVGKISSQIICKNFVQYAGQLTGIVGAFGDSTGEDADYQGTITLDFADESASANIVTYYEEMRLCDSFIIPDGKALTDGTNIYTGTLSADDLTAISGQTLRPCLVLADDIIGDETLANNDGMTLTVALANRTIDTEWNTIALPFDVSAEQLTETFGAGVKLYELTGSSLVGDVLGLEFTSATSIEAGKPYFIKASADVTNPTFHGVTIEASANNPRATDYVDFVPTLGVTKVEGSDLREVLVLGGGNTLYNPSVLPAMMKGFRGFFRVHGVAANAAQFRMTFAEESEISGIFRVAGDNGTDGCIYNLMGQRVNRAEKGLFIVKGKRVIIQ